MILFDVGIYMMHTLCRVSSLSLMTVVVNIALYCWESCDLIFEFNCMNKLFLPYKTEHRKFHRNYERANKCEQMKNHE